MKKNQYRISSRRKTPWDGFLYLDPLEEYIKSKYLDNYDYHHPTLSQSNEALLFNRYEVDFCHVCGSKRIIKKGLYKTGLQKYYCQDCRHYFCITTNTIFDNHKIPISEWIEYLLNLFNYSSFELNAKVNKNASTTIKYWVKKVFLLLEDYQEEIVLKDEVYIDEFYYSDIARNIIKKDNKELRGLSRNKYCIGIGIDKDQVYCHLEGKGKSSINKTYKCFKDHIEYGSIIHHDEENSHQKLIDDLGLISTIHNTKETKGLDDKHNPMRPINVICAALRAFLDAHSGFNREELCDYLNLFSFIMNKPKDRLLKVEYLLNKALFTTKSIRFRDYYAKKGPK